MLQRIPSATVPLVWPTVAPMIQKAIKQSQEDFWINDILHEVLADRMQLWVWNEGGTVKACCVTRLATFPRKKICQVPYLAGIGFRNWIQSEATIGEWAKTQGCVQLEGYCRDGWLKVLNPLNWFKVWTTMRKEL